MYVGVDIGGTNIAVGLVTGDGKLMVKKSCPTKAHRSNKEVIGNIIKTIQLVIDESGTDKTDILGVGIGIPGISDIDTGNVIECVNLGWKDVPLKRIIEKELNKTVFIANDASVAALAEYEIGSLKGTSNSILLTIGTGVGGGIILNGRLYSGSYYRASEIGHMIVGENYYDCSCGNNGCLETFASATALIKHTKKLIEETNEETIILDKINGNLELLDAKIIIDCSKEGDAIAKMSFDRFIKYLSIGISNLINVFDPEVVALGGGVSKSGEHLLNSIKQNTYNKIIFKDVKCGKITLAELGNEAGIIGAAMLCKHYYIIS